MRRIKTEKGQKAKKRIYIESLLVFFIILAPFILKVYELVPETESTKILGVEVDGGTWPDVQVYVWFVLQKVVPLYLILICLYT